jgi:hypothetical protein
MIMELNRMTRRSVGLSSRAAPRRAARKKV